jgi:hypothetical protein
MSIENEDTAAKRVMRKNENINIPDQTEKEEFKPYSRDKALNEANKRRFGEKIRPDPPDPCNTVKHDTEKEF